jgi:hypothetical protein
MKLKLYFLLYITDLHVARLEVFSDFRKVTFSCVTGRAVAVISTIAVRGTKGEGL